MSQGVAGAEKENEYQMISNTAFLGKKLLEKKPNFVSYHYKGRVNFITVNVIGSEGSIS